MSEENTGKENPDNPGGDDPTVEPNIKELEEKNKQLFERAKKAEEAEKLLKQKLKDAVKEPEEEPKKEEPTQKGMGLDEILDVQEAIKDLNGEEIAELRLRAKARGVSLSQARKDETFNLTLEAMRAKVAKDNNIPNPSNPSGAKGRIEKSFQDIKNMSEEEYREFLKQRKNQE